MSEHLAAAAQKLGAPEELVERSARARAEAQGASVDDILAAWAGGEAVPTAAPAPTADTAAEAPEAAPAEEAAPTPDAPTPATEPEPAAPAPAAAAAPAAVAVAARLDAAPLVESRRQNVWLLLAGVGLIFVFGALVSFIIPASSGADDRHVVDRVALDDLAERGREVYIREGCWYCHTQQVRPIVADVGLGPVTETGSEALNTPAATGNQRIGPDISGFANLESLTEVAVEFLRHPTEAREDSWQPSYGYLSDDDLLAVAAYVVAPKTDIEPEAEETSDE